MLHKKIKVLIFFFICLIFCCAGIYAGDKISVYINIEYSLQNESGKNDISPVFDLGQSVYLTLKYKTKKKINFENAGRQIGSFFSKKADERHVVTEIAIPYSLNPNISRCIYANMIDNFEFVDENNFYHIFFSLPIDSKDKTIEFFLNPSEAGRFHIGIRNYLVNGSVDNMQLDECISKGMFVNLSESSSDFSLSIIDR